VSGATDTSVRSLAKWGTLCDPHDAAPKLGFALPSKSRFLPIAKENHCAVWAPIDKDRQ
jgi:hypothetical protein